MRFALNLVARILLVLCLVTNVAYAQSVETQGFEEVASPRSVEPVQVEATPAQSSSFARFVFTSVVSAVAVVAAVVTNSPVDSVGYLAVAIGADHMRE